MESENLDEISHSYRSPSTESYHGGNNINHKNKNVILTAYSFDNDFDKLVENGYCEGLSVSKIQPDGSVIRKIAKNCTPSSVKPLKCKIEYLEYEDGEKIETHTNFLKDEKVQIKVYHSSVTNGEVKPTKSSQPNGCVNYNSVYPFNNKKPIVIPVETPNLCPKVLKILEEIGLQKYEELFKREEIDYEVFKMLTEEDLVEIGITSDSSEMELLKKTIEEHLNVSNTEEV